MLNIISVDAWDILWSGMFCLLLFITAILFFKWMWVDKMVFDIPRGAYKINKDYKDSIKVGSLSDYVYVMWTLLTDLDITYWLEYIGLEGMNLLMQAIVTFTS